MTHYTFYQAQTQLALRSWAPITSRGIVLDTLSKTYPRQFHLTQKPGLEVTIPLKIRQYS